MHTLNLNLDSMRNPRFAKETTSCTHGERVSGSGERREYVHHTTDRKEAEQLIAAISVKINVRNQSLSPNLSAISRGAWRFWDERMQKKCHESFHITSNCG